MKFAFHPTMCPTDQYLPLCKAAEELGYDTFTFPDSICYPKEGSDVYPYNSDGTREFLDGVPFLEPFVAIPYLAAHCPTIRFSTSVVKLAIRQPAVVAKQLSSMAALIGDRFDFGIGISPWPEDFEATQIAWEKRGKRMDEMMEIINGLMSGEYFGYDGEIFQMAPIKLTPVPDFHVPMIVGGHANPALRRAARLGDGWIAAGGKVADYEVMIDKLNAYLDDYGRDRSSFQIQAMSHDSFTVEGLTRLAALGVTEVIVAFRDVYSSEPDTKSVEEKIGELQWYADNLIKPYRQSLAS